jgi:integrase
VLRREFGQLDGVVRAKRQRYVPVVLSHAETEAILGELQPPYRLVGLLLYGCGLRLAECVNLRVQCFNLDSMLLTVHDGKGQNYAKVVVMQRCHAVGTNLHPTATGICGASESTNALRLRPDLGLAMPE